MAGYVCEPENLTELVRVLGGTVRVSETFGVTPQAVSNWLRLGALPPHLHARMLALCVERGILWRPPGWPPQVQLRFNARVKEPEDQVAA